MSNFKDVLKNIDSEKSKLTNVNSGKLFEEKIIKKFRDCGYINYSKGEDKILDKYVEEIKPLIQTKLGSSLIDNQLKLKDKKYTKFIFWQPYGSQDYPDFLVFTDYKVYSLEIKYTTDKSKKPMWNSNLPKKDGIYIFGSYGLKDITFFIGEDILPEKERSFLVAFWENTDKVYEEWVKTFNSKIKAEVIDNTYGFSPYIRKAYQQTQNNNNEAILDYFSNPNRKKLEDNTFKFILDTDKLTSDIESEKEESSGA